MLRHASRSVLVLTLCAVGCLSFCATARAADVLIQVEGRVAQNSFVSYPLNTTPLGARVVFSCLADSESGFEFVPGVRFGIQITTMKMTIDDGQGGSIYMSASGPRSMSFSTVGITPAIPDNDQMEFDPITLNFGSALNFRQTFKVIDGDNASWPSPDLSHLSACGVPGSNFQNPENGDRIHWYLEGVETLGVLNFELVSIRQFGISAGDGDMNGDGSPNGDDLQPFVRAVIDGSIDADDLCHGDFSMNGVVDTNDIPGMVDVLLTGNIPLPTPPTSGACCYLDVNFFPACDDVATQDDCQALSGFNQQFTLGASCETLEPPCGGGSCCFFDGSCQEIGLPESSNASTDCASAGGQFIEGGTCEPNHCPGAPTACCLTDTFGNPSGTCIFVVPDDCAAMNGIPEFEGGVPCDPNPCLVACCVSDGSCVEMTEIQCNDAGGSYQLEQHSCEYYKCPPANDDCANAIPITEGSILFDIGGATTDGDELPQFTPGCEQGLATENYIDQDIWYTYTASCTGVVQIDTCGSYDLGDSSNTTIAVYDDCDTCPPSSVDNLVVCNNREQAAPIQLCYGNGGSGADAAMRFDAVAGQCYKIRLGTETGTPSGVGVLNIVCGGACCPPDGGLCTIETQDYCEQVIGGYYGGDGTDCDFTTCPGACCHHEGDTIVCEIVNGVNTCLIDLQGTYLGDATQCEPGICGGACCLAQTSECVETSPEDCTAQGGDYLGDGIACTYDSFGISTCATGACCDGVTCVNEVRGTCAFEFFAGEDCATYVCLDARPGVCCDGINCQETLYGECNGPNTSFYFNQTCATFTCPAARIGACCLGDGSCEELNVPDCESAAGVYQGESTTCAGTTCPTP